MTSTARRFGSISAGVLAGAVAAFLGGSALVAWLEDETSAVQALAALATVGVTGVLALYTRSYIRLTREMAEAAAGQLAQQMAFHRDAEIAEWRELWGLARLLDHSLERMPDESRQSSMDGDLRTAPLWDRADLVRFLALASHMSSVSGTEASLVVASMTWLREVIDRVRATPRATGFNYESANFSWPLWCQHVATAREQLARVKAVVGQKLGDRAD